MARSLLERLCLTVKGGLQSISSRIIWSGRWRAPIGGMPHMLQHNSALATQVIVLPTRASRRRHVLSNVNFLTSAPVALTLLRACRTTANYSDGGCGGCIWVSSRVPSSLRGCTPINW